MDAQRRRQALEAASAAARRLLMCAIDIRFDLEELFEVDPDAHWLGVPDLYALRSAANTIQDEIERLAQAVRVDSAAADGASEDDEAVLETFQC